MNTVIYDECKHCEMNGLLISEKGQRRKCRFCRNIEPSARDVVLFLSCSSSIGWHHEDASRNWLTGSSNFEIFFEKELAEKDLSRRMKQLSEFYKRDFKPITVEGLAGMYIVPNSGTPIFLYLKTTLSNISNYKNSIIEQCADVAEYHNPQRFRGGYANGLIEGNPMWDIAKGIRELKDF